MFTVFVDANVVMQCRDASEAKLQAYCQRAFYPSASVFVLPA